MTIDLRLGDCLSVMAELPENSVDTIITDPPYGLTFMGKDWDKGVPGVAFWEQALRVAKPGAMLLAMGGTRTFHRLVCAIEDAGFEIRDTIAWLYGSGFPKSYDISKGIDKQAGAEREVVGKYESPENTSGGKGRKFCHGGQPLDGLPVITAPSTPAAQLWHGWGTALKPAMELICVAMKPIDGNFVNNALTWGVAGYWIDGGRVGTDEMQINTYFGRGPFGDSQVGNDYDSKITRGRFPANLIHDGSDEVVGLFPVTHPAGNKEPSPADKGMFGVGRMAFRDTYGDDGRSAARFFYCAKASRSERNAGLEGMEERAKTEVYGSGLNSATKCDPKMHTPEGVARRPLTKNGHPTVKPLALMRYLARLTKTPTGGVVLDPFMGSGTTGMAAVLEGRDFIGIELNAEYLEIAERRIAHAQGSIPVELPLFAEVVSANTD